VIWCTVLPSSRRAPLLPPLRRMRPPASARWRRAGGRARAAPGGAGGGAPGPPRGGGAPPPPPPPARAGEARGPPGRADAAPGYHGGTCTERFSPLNPTAALVTISPTHPYVLSKTLPPASAPDPRRIFSRPSRTTGSVADRRLPTNRPQAKPPSEGDPFPQSARCAMQTCPLHNRSMSIV
jgi:hypothetical protein